MSWATESPDFAILAGPELWMFLPGKSLMSWPDHHKQKEKCVSTWLNKVQVSEESGLR